MKKLITLFTLLFASQAFASWDVNQNGVAVEVSKNRPFSMAILEYAEGVYLVSFFEKKIGEKCESGEVVREVNGQLVQLLDLCDRGSSRYYGKTEEGREFILNEFKTKNSVKVGSTVYGAIGFSAALSKVKQRVELEKKAL